MEDNICEYTQRDKRFCGYYCRCKKNDSDAFDDDLFDDDDDSDDDD